MNASGTEHDGIDVKAEELNKKDSLGLGWRLEDDDQYGKVVSLSRRGRHPVSGDEIADLYHRALELKEERDAAAEALVVQGKVAGDTVGRLRRLLERVQALFIHAEGLIEKGGEISGTDALLRGMIERIRPDIDTALGEGERIDRGRQATEPDRSRDRVPAPSPLSEHALMPASTPRVLLEIYRLLRDRLPRDHAYSAKPDIDAALGEGARRDPKTTGAGAVADCPSPRGADEAQDQTAPSPIEAPYDPHNAASLLPRVCDLEAQLVNVRADLKALARALAALEKRHDSHVHNTRVRPVSPESMTVFTSGGSIPRRDDTEAQRRGSDD